MIDPAELPDHIRAEIEAARALTLEQEAARAAAEAELARLKTRFTELQKAELAAYPARYLVGTGDAALEAAKARMGTNEVESAEAAARRFAGELQRLQDGLIAAGVRVDPNAPVDTAAVDAALALVADTLEVRRAAERADSDPEAGRLAVMQAMGWSDDRGSTEYAGAMWELAGEVAEAVVLAVEPPGPAITGPEWVTTPADQHEREQAVIAAATAYREACRELDWRAEIQPRFDALGQIRATVDALQAATR